jgi:hypothetical protein
LSSFTLYISLRGVSLLFVPERKEMDFADLLQSCPDSSGLKAIVAIIKIVTESGV